MCLQTVTRRRRVCKKKRKRKRKRKKKNKKKSLCCQAAMQTTTETYTQFNGIFSLSAGLAEMMVTAPMEGNFGDSPILLFDRAE
mmetsp:Transcript_85868/g.179450  ORF Transcript_85868/g.179450 Transcript_85868/m.179450 type:complete len:84 (-) Transcript_85868:1308-1559(-)